MAENIIDVNSLKQMFLAGAKNLEAKKEWINELNVFPVPDGDTGTNMCMTIMAAVREVNELQDPTMAQLAKAISSGSLRGARGNSGVILSQLLRGFTHGITHHSEITIATIASSFQRATDTAYKAVMRPKEGTILTVARGIAEKAEELAEAETSMDLETFFREILIHGREVLDSTPDLLPVLKEAGVVDSGGQGLLTVLEGAFRAYTGEEQDLSFDIGQASGAPVKISRETEESITFGYCTEFIIVTDKPMTEKDERAFKDFLSSIGDSIVVVADDEIVKVHVHTNDPGLAIQKALTHGYLTNMKIDNMRLEHQEKVIKDAERIAARQQAAEEGRAAEEPWKKHGSLAVAAGAGFANLFKELGIDRVIEGGQTMNPSTEDIFNAIQSINAGTVYVFPNNKNIIMAANQAAELAEDKRVIVIPTKTIPQCITAMINFDPDGEDDDNAEVMKEAITTVGTAEITYAVRDTSIGGIQIHEGDIMAVGDDGILSVGKSVEEVALTSLKEMGAESAELISLYYGQEYSEDQAEFLHDKIAETFSNCDIEVACGGQPVYYCILSVE